MRLWTMIIAGASVLALGATTGASQEGRRGSPPGQPPFFERLDANKDGKISLDDVPEGAPEHVKQMLSRADRDGDKILTKDELGPVMRRLHAGWSGRERSGDPRSVERTGPPSRGGDGRGPDARRGPSPGRGESHFSGIDKNKDGAIDREEAVGRMKEHFDRVDANKDGKIDREEGRRAMMAVAKTRLEGRGPHTYRGMRGPGGPQFGRSAMDRGSKGPAMWHRGPWGGPPMDRGMRGPGGPEMGRGTRGPEGPQFDRSPMARGPRGSMTSHHGSPRGPEAGRRTEGPKEPRMDRGHDRPDRSAPDAKAPDRPRMPVEKKAKPEKDEGEKKE